LWRPFDIRPLTYLTFWIDEKLGGENPAGFHAVNLLLHLIAIMLVWDVLGRLIPRNAALIATAIFAVHPFQAEPVNYIFARSTLLATVLCLASLAAWLRGHPWWATLWFAGALLAKEECVAFPVLLLLLNSGNAGLKAGGSQECLPHKTQDIVGQPFRAAAGLLPGLRKVAVMFALSLAAGIRVMLAARSTPGSGAGMQAAVSWQAYLSAQGLVILRYLRMMLLPWGFTVDPDIPIPPAWIGAIAWLVVLSLVGLAALRFSRARAGFWFLTGLILLLPSSSIFPATDLAADRRMYLPMLGFAACAGLLLERVRPGFLVPVLLLLTGLSFERTATWLTEEQLWTDAVEKAPRKVRPKIQLARAVESGRAIRILEEARHIAPEDPQIASEEGRIYLSEGRPAEALQHFGRALALAPSSADALNNRGAALAALDQKDAARQDFERALAIDPCQFHARLNLQHLGISKPMPAGCRFNAEQSRALEGK